MLCVKEINLKKAVQHRDTEDIEINHKQIQQITARLDSLRIHPKGELFSCFFSNDFSVFSVTLCFKSVFWINECKENRRFSRASVGKVYSWPLLRLSAPANWLISRDGLLALFLHNS